MVWREAPGHDVDHGETDEGGNGGGIALEVARQAPVAADPRERPLDDPAFCRTSNPAVSDRLTICSLQTPVRHTVSAILGSAYPPSAKMSSMNGNGRRAQRSKWRATAVAALEHPGLAARLAEIAG
jgi:hypothetical protein